MFLGHSGVGMAKLLRDYEHGHTLHREATGICVSKNMEAYFGRNFCGVARLLDRAGLLSMPPFAARRSTKYHVIADTACYQLRKEVYAFIRESDVPCLSAFTLGNEHRSHG